MARKTRRKTIYGGKKKHGKFTKPKKKKKSSNRLKKQKQKMKEKQSKLIPSSAIFSLVDETPAKRPSKRSLRIKRRSMSKFPGLVARQPRKNMSYRSVSKIDTRRMSSVNGKKDYQRQMKQFKNIDGEIEGISLDQKNDKIIIRQLP